MGRYIDLDFFQEYTRTTYTSETTPTSSFVESLIELSEQEIDEKSGRTWDSETHTSELYDEPQRELLLKNYPVISVSSVVDGDDVTLTEGIDEDYTVDGDFIVFNKTKTVPDRVYVTYTSGYSGVRTAAQILATLLTIKKIRQSQSTKYSNTKTIKLGSITIDKSLGLQTVLTLDKDIDFYWRQLRRLVR